MTTRLTTPSAADADDGPAIAELHRLFAAQRRGFPADPYPAAASGEAAATGAQAATGRPASTGEAATAGEAAAAGDG